MCVKQKALQTTERYDANVCVQTFDDKTDTIEESY